MGHFWSKKIYCGQASSKRKRLHSGNRSIATTCISLTYHNFSFSDLATTYSAPLPHSTKLRKDSRFQPPLSLHKAQTMRFAAQERELDSLESLRHSSSQACDASLDHQQTIFPFSSKIEWKSYSMVFVRFFVWCFVTFARVFRITHPNETESQRKTPANPSGKYTTLAAGARTTCRTKASTYSAKLQWPGLKKCRVDSQPYHKTYSKRRSAKSRTEPLQWVHKPELHLCNLTLRTQKNILRFKTSDIIWSQEMLLTLFLHKVSTFKDPAFEGLHPLDHLSPVSLNTSQPNKIRDVLALALHQGLEVLSESGMI